jgi:Tfp pilus assembly PilM family ATPase
MGRRAIGIDIGLHHIRAVQMARDGDRLVIERTFTSPMRRSTDQPDETLRALSSHHGFDWQADVAVAMPSDSVFYRELTVQTQVLEEIRRGDVAALADSLPLPTDQMVARICSQRPIPPDRHSILMAVTTESAIQDRLEILAHVHPKVVDAEAFALCNVVLANHPQAARGRVVIASSVADHLTLIILQDGLVLFVRNMPWNTDAEQDTPDHVADSVRVTYQKVFGCPIEGEGVVFRVTGDVPAEASAQGLDQALDCPVTEVDPYAKVATQADRAQPAEIVIAEGLAIRALAPRQTYGVDFLATDTLAKRPKASLRRELALCGTLICAIGMVWLIGLWTQVSSMESHYNQIKTQMTDLFHKTLPDEKHIVSPLAQVQQRLDRVQRDYRSLAELERGDTGPLLVLERLGKARQGLDDVVIQDLLITTDEVRVQGSCRSFEQVYQWQRRIETIQDFARVQVEPPTRDPQNGQVSFTVLIGLAKERDHDRP